MLTTATFCGSIPSMSAHECDFCGRRNVAWVYTAKPFQHSPLGSNTNWLTCYECHKLIQENKRIHLAKRALDHIRQFVPFPADFRACLFPEVRQLHDLFFANRTGLPRKFVKRSWAIE